MKYLLALLLAAAASCTAYAADAPAYKRSTLSLPGRLLCAVAGDLDGDGLKDVTAFCLDADAKGGPRRVAAVYYQDKGGTFGGKPAQVLPVPADAVACDVAAAGKGPGRSPAYIAPDGVYAYLPKGQGRAGGYETKPARLVEAAGVFTQADPLDLPRWPFFSEGGNGAPAALLVPGVGRLSVYALGEGGYSRLGSMWLKSKGTTFEQASSEGADGSLTIVHKVFVARRMDFSGKGNRDVVVTWDDNADVWLMRPDGGYPERPDISFRPGLLDNSGKNPIEGAWVKPVDLDADGLCDLVVTKKTGSVAHTKSLLFVYLRNRAGGFPSKPNKTIITEGVVGPRFVDFNGDGRRDILLPSVKLGISNFVNMLTTKQVNVELAVYLQDNSGSYPDTPTRQKSVRFKLDIANLGKKAAPVLDTGRFTKGPGYGLAAVTKADEVSVYMPDRYSMLSDKPGLELDVDAPTGIDIGDLGTDGIDDMVMTYAGVEGKEGLINVFVSR